MLSLAFNKYAKEYDDHFTRSPIGILQRKRVYHYLLPLLNKNTTLLEINCGTGHDALTISTLVKNIVASDISQGMIDVAKAKKKEWNNTNIEFILADSNSIHQHINSNFDMVLSNFGGLNCLNSDELKLFSKNINAHLTSKAKLVFVIMGKKCWWEKLYYTLKKDQRANRRNTANGIETQIDGNSFYTYYHSPTEIKDYFKEHFNTIKLKPIGFFIPPSYLNDYFSTKKWALSILDLLEKISSLFSFTANYSDHYLIILEKKIN